MDLALEETADSQLPFQESRMHQIIDTYQYTIRLLLTIPSTSEIEKFVEKEKSKRYRQISRCPVSVRWTTPRGV